MILLTTKPITSSLVRKPASRRPGGNALVAGILVFLSATGCVRFKIDEMSEREILRVKFGEDTRQLKIPVRGRNPVNLPNRVYARDGRVYIANINDNTVRVYDTDGELELLLRASRPDSKTPGKKSGAKKPGGKQATGKKTAPGTDATGQIIATPDQDYRLVEFPFSQVVAVYPGAEETFYVQNRILPRSPAASADAAANKKAPAQSGAPGSSYLLHFDGQGKLIASIGTEGRQNLVPFGYIIRADLDEKGNLIVLHQDRLEKTLSWINPAGERIQVIYASDLELAPGPEDKEHDVELEDMIPWPSGLDFAVSVAYRDNQGKDEISHRLKYRKIIKYRRTSPKNPRVLLEISDTKESLFWTLPDGGFLTQHNDDSDDRALFQVYDPAGNHINNKRIEYPGKRMNWRESYADLGNRVYNLYATDQYFAVYEWN